MRIAYVLVEGYATLQNGIISQALNWRMSIEEMGHTVDLISMWDKNHWEEYDIIHYFGHSSYMAQHIKRLHGHSARIVVSPILDPDYPVWKLWLLSRFGYGTMVTNYYHSFREVKDKINLVLTRSEFEKKYITKGVGFKKEQCTTIPLSCDIPVEATASQEKENFCFHCSLLADKRKNVKRLIEAARKYHFKLILGGYLRTDEEKKLIESWIGDAPNIEYRGHLSKKDLFDLYSRAKVFALPSTNEGVGIVGLEAALMGCDIVLTSYGGPKEYYNGMAKIVNPYSVDDIGQAIVDLLNRETRPNKLSEHIRRQYSAELIAIQLETSYQNLLHDDCR